MVHETGPVAHTEGNYGTYLYLTKFTIILTSCVILSRSICHPLVYTINVELYRVPANCSVVSEHEMNPGVVWYHIVPL